MKQIAIGLILLCASVQANADDVPTFPARLIGHAELPAQSFTRPPADAPPYFNMSGRFTGAELREEQINSIFGARTGIYRPFAGQALQGFSGLRYLGENRVLVVSDNGFGAKSNSADALLMVHILHLQWDTGRVMPEDTVFLSDPYRLVPFPILNEASDHRYLTGFDFDFESIQHVGDSYWLGDEFGPWLVETNRNGEVLQVHPTNPGDALIQSPDNMLVRSPNPGAALPPTVTVPRSGGFEGMALDQSGTILYPILEKPLRDATGEPETVNGAPVVLLLEFDTTTNTWND
ncbi:MAG: esterase-like activity of phytase family protein, partial [Pseudomonadota bacterium]